MRPIIEKNFLEHNSLISQISNKEIYGKIEDISKEIILSCKQNNKTLIAGNGGSAADAQHIAAELVNSFYNPERQALSAIALSTDTSIITAWANDKSYDLIFKRQIEAHGRRGDVFMAISTSGNSANLVNALAIAKQMGLVTISLLGKSGGKMKGLSDYEIIIPSNDTPRIQEAHELIYHTICQLVEKSFLQ